MNGDKYGGSPQAKGVVVSCSPQWIYFGILSTCEVRTPGENHPVVQGNDWVPDELITVPGESLGDATVNDTVWLTYDEGGTAKGPNGHKGHMESPSEWEVAQPAPHYGLAPPVQVVLWILAGWCAYRTIVAFKRRSEVRPSPEEKHEVEGNDKFVVILMAVLTIGFLAGAYLVHWAFISGSESGAVGTVLAWIGTVVLALAGLAFLLATGVMWNSARQGDSGDANQKTASQ